MWACAACARACRFCMDIYTFHFTCHLLSITRMPDTVCAACARTCGCCYLSPCSRCCRNDPDKGKLMMLLAMCFPGQDSLSSYPVFYFTHCHILYVYPLATTSLIAYLQHASCLILMLPRIDMRLL